MDPEFCDEARMIRHIWPQRVSRPEAALLFAFGWVIGAVGEGGKVEVLGLKGTCGVRGGGGRLKG